MEPKKIINSALAGVLVVLAFNPLMQNKLLAQVSASGQDEKPAAGQPAAPPASSANPAAKPAPEIRKALTAPNPVLEIKRLESEAALYSIELRDVQLNDLFRVIAHDYNLNILIDPAVSGTITASFTNISLE